MTADISHVDWLKKASTQTVFDALEAVDKGGSRFVGGCVRNALLGVPVSDIDIATRLVPEDTIKALEAAGIRAIPTGVEHGTVTAVCDHEPFEITTLRRDVETDGRRAVVAFSKDWAEDALRRDFHMNALYADVSGQVYDPTGKGLSDIADRRVAFIGEAEDRLREDHLRNLRFFRFSAWYGRGLDETGLQACGELREGLRQIAAERIWKELEKLLAAKWPYPALHAMYETGVMGVILPECDGLARLEALSALELNEGNTFEPMTRLMALLPRKGEVAKAVGERLKMSRAEQTRLKLWAQTTAPPIPEGDKLTAYREWLYRAARPTGVDVTVWELSSSGAEPDALPDDLVDTCLNWPLPEFPVTGADLISKGAKPGPELGQRLQGLEDAWIANGFSMDGL
ncbi:MAG: CCA tRNA nucleotidyltransferase [Ponticaulis sp.]|nr:CCA tRNA nucleotidyltransferase [Ponticaulis sp.]